MRKEIYFDEYGNAYVYKRDHFGIFIISLFVFFATIMFVAVPAEKKKAAKYAEEAISNAKAIEINVEYSEKTNKNTFEISRWKGYSFELTESGIIDIEYSCKRIRDHGTSGPTWVIWRLVDKKTGAVLQESEWAKFEHEPFELKKGSYVLEFASISNQWGFDGRKRPFAFTIHFESNKR